MTIDSETASDLLAEGNPLLGKGIRKILDKKDLGEDGPNFEAAARDSLSQPYVVPQPIQPLTHWIVDDAGVTEAFHLPYTTGAAKLCDLTSTYRICTMVALSWPDLVRHLVHLLAKTLRRCPHAHTLIVYMDSTRRNMQRVLTLIERLKITPEQKAALYRAFDFGDPDTTATVATLEAQMEPLTGAQHAMMGFFNDPARSVHELAELAELHTPYQLACAPTWFSDPRVRKAVFIPLLARALADGRCLHTIFQAYNWDLGVWPALIADALLGVPGCAPDDERVLVAAYPRTIIGPPSHDCGVFPEARSIAPTDLYRLQADGPQMFRHEVESDFNMVTMAFWLRRFFGITPVVDNFDGDVLLALLVFDELFRVLPESVIHGGADAIEPARIKDRRVQEWPRPRSEHTRVQAPIFWVRNTSRWWTVVDIDAAYACLHAHCNRMLAYRTKMAFTPPPLPPLYPGEPEVSAEMPGLALLFAASVPNDYVLVKLKNVPSPLIERLLDIMQSGVGYMRCPGRDGLVPYARMGYIRSRAFACQNAMAYGMSLHTAAYFLQAAPCIAPMTTMAAAWADPRARPTIDNDVFQYFHWAQSPEIKKGRIPVRADCDGGHFERLRAVDTIIADEAITFSLVLGPADYEQMLLDFEGAPHMDHPLDGFDFAFPVLGEREVPPPPPVRKRPLGDETEAAGSSADRGPPPAYPARAPPPYEAAALPEIAAPADAPDALAPEIAAQAAPAPDAPAAAIDPPPPQADVDTTTQVDVPVIVVEPPAEHAPYVFIDPTDMAAIVQTDPPAPAAHLPLGSVTEWGAVVVSAFDQARHLLSDWL